MVEPGIQMEIAGIPAAVTIDHNENLFYWQLWDIKKATKLTVDAHKDTWNGVAREHPAIKKWQDYHTQVSITGHNCPAVHYGMVSSLYWLNPHAQKYQKLKKFETSSGLLQTLERKNLGGDSFLFWGSDSGVTHLDANDCHPTSEVQSNGRLLLDIDLDGFACLGFHEDQEDCKLDDLYENVEGYERRIKQTLDFLRKNKRPAWITITRSEGQVLPESRFRLTDIEDFTPIGADKLITGTRRYVPKDLVDEVQDLTIRGLNRIYSSCINL